jgi:hypothetical protein
MSEENIQTVMTAEDFATEVAAIVYNNSKAKILNLIEVIMPPSPQQNAARQIVLDTIKGVSKTAHDFIIDVLGEDWKQTVGCQEITVTADVITDRNKIDEIVKGISDKLRFEKRV